MMIGIDNQQNLLVLLVYQNDVMKEIELDMEWLWDLFEVVWDDGLMNVELAGDEGHLERDILLGLVPEVDCLRLIFFLVIVLGTFYLVLLLDSG